MSLSRSTLAYARKDTGDEPVIVVLQELAERFPDRGFGKYYRLIRRRGHGWNHKRVYRVLQGKPGFCLQPHGRGDARCVATVGCPRIGQVLRLAWPVAALPAVAGKFAADGGRVTVEQTGNLALGVTGFAEDVNLVSFVLGQMRVVHWATSTWRLMGQNAHAF